MNNKEKTELLTGLKGWLGESGMRFFTWCAEKYGTVSPVYSEHSMPHSVHFREGMQVRNYLRTCYPCKLWSAHKLDDMWCSLVTQALGIELYCDDCRYLFPKEYEQSAKKEQHRCTLLEAVVLHRGSHPRIPRPYECIHYSKSKMEYGGNCAYTK